TTSATRRPARSWPTSSGSRGRGSPSGCAPGSPQELDVLGPAEEAVEPDAVDRPAPAAEGHRGVGERGGAEDALVEDVEVEVDAGPDHPPPRECHVRVELAQPTVEVERVLGHAAAVGPLRPEVDAEAPPVAHALRDRPVPRG